MTWATFFKREAIKIHSKISMSIKEIEVIFKNFIEKGNSKHNWFHKWMIMNIWRRNNHNSKKIDKCQKIEGEILSNSFYESRIDVIPKTEQENKEQGKQNTNKQTDIHHEHRCYNLQQNITKLNIVMYLENDSP